ncbi:RBP1 protein, partial [Campylorhamphus procurvoides]|nr:RBP1 protein [Campylorhamphus procurvoides]
MTKCFLLPTSSPSEKHQVENRVGFLILPAPKKISPTKFLGLYCTSEASPPHENLLKPPDTVANDEKEHGKKKGKFKKKIK